LLLVVHRRDATRGDALAHQTGAPWAAWSRSGTTRLAIPEDVTVFQLTSDASWCI
jgi:hypothetical protein